MKGLAEGRSQGHQVASLGTHHPSCPRPPDVQCAPDPCARMSPALPCSLPGALTCVAVVDHEELAGMFIPVACQVQHLQGGVETHLPPLHVNGRLSLSPTVRVFPRPVLFIQLSICNRREWGTIQGLPSQAPSTAPYQTTGQGLRETHRAAF
jgi:hypothetical protein